MQYFSELFTKTKKQAPGDETSLNAKLLIRAGFIYKEMAGVYAYLPLGLRVLEKIKKIVREEMNLIGGQEIIMTALQRKELWEKTDRWSDEKVDIWFKSKLKNESEVGFGWSHEEPITEMMKYFLESYKDLPAYVYQFQTKLRNEIRAKSGILRGREFLMKDLYSYCKNEEEHKIFYEKVIVAYKNIFERCGIGDITYVTFASGGAFTKFSHEFQTLTEAGEDIIYLSKEKNIAINKEVLTDEVLAELEVNKKDLVEVKACEIGNIFSFGTSKCDQLELQVNGDDGSKKSVVLGSYGIGITRLMGLLVEIFNDEKGILWPKNLAPYDIYFINLAKEKNEKAVKLVQIIENTGKEVLYDDRDISAGEKFADADLIGIPIRIVISNKTLEKNSVEIKFRNSEKIELVEFENLEEYLKSY